MYQPWKAKHLNFCITQLWKAAVSFIFYFLFFIFFLNKKLRDSWTTRSPVINTHADFNRPPLPHHGDCWQRRPQRIMPSRYKWLVQELEKTNQEKERGFAVNSVVIMIYKNSWTVNGVLSRAFALLHDAPRVESQVRSG